MTRRRADLLLITAAAVWGVSFVVVKDALTSASPLFFLAARFTIATIVLAPFVNLRGGFSRGELRTGLILTLLLASGFATQAYGLQYTTPARSAFIVAMSSVLAPFIALVLLRHRIGWMVVLALLIAGLGIYFLTAPAAGGLNRGDLWTLVTAVVFGGHIGDRRGSRGTAIGKPAVRVVGRSRCSAAVSRHHVDGRGARLAVPGAARDVVRPRLADLLFRARVRRVDVVALLGRAVLCIAGGGRQPDTRWHGPRCRRRVARRGCPSRSSATPDLDLSSGRRVLHA